MDSKIKVGTYTGTAAALTVEIGFVPSVMIVSNSSDCDTLAIWTSSMADAYGFVIDGSPAAITSGGITPYTGTSIPAALTGTFTVVAGDATITGSGSAMTTELKAGDIVDIDGQKRKILDITSATVATATEVFDTSKSGKAGVRLTGRQAGVAIGTDTTGFNESAKTYVYIAIKE